MDILARKFEMEMLNKESKYARTGWVYNWNTRGVYTQKYRVRATIKLSPSGENLDIKSEHSTVVNLDGNQDLMTDFYKL